MNATEKINQVISEKLSIDLENIAPESNFVSDLGADSLDLVELIMSLEEALSLDISDQDAEDLETVQDVYDFVKKTIGEQAWNEFNGE